MLSEAGLPLPDGEDVPVRMVVLREGGRLAGCAGWERHGGVALLRSVAVRPEAQRRGAGRELVGAVLERAGAEGAREAVLLTTGAEAFFAGLGFVRIAREALPPEVKGARQVATQCCASAACMRRGALLPPSGFSL